jgi:arylsulfatase A-like enzyme
MKKKIIAVMVLLLVIAAGIVVYVSKDTRSDETNVVFVTVDTLRADRLGAYGYEKIDTGHIDALAKRGVLFSQAAAQVPITLPSHASIFTALNPITHNVRENGAYVVSDDETTLAEILKEHAYATAAFLGAFPLDKRFGLNQGFDIYDDDLQVAGQKPQMRQWQGHEFSSFERKAEHVVRAALDWLTKNRQQKFFIWLHVYDPHRMYIPPPPFREQYKDRPYDGEVAYVDHALGSFFKKLEEWELLENTLIVFLSDHGESLGEHKYLGHGERLYQPSMHIPLIMSHPGELPEGKVVDSLVRSIDIMPTVLDILSIAPPKNIEGVSLLSLMSDDGGEAAELSSYGETLLHKLRYGKDELRSFRTKKWKYIRFVHDQKTVAEELYDLEADPGELVNLSGSKTSVVEKLSSQLDGFVKDDKGKDNAKDMDEETVEKLRALGYLE